MNAPICRRRFLETIALGAAAAGSAGFPRPARAENQAGGWKRSAENPVLSLGGEGDFDRHNIFAPAVAKEGGRYFLFYSGGPTGPADGGFVEYQLGLALSDDGVHFEKLPRPLLPLGERDNFHATPALLRDAQGGLVKREGTWQMAYCGNRADDVELATSRDGIHWQKDPRSPIYRSAYAPNLVQTEGGLRMYYIRKPAGKPWEIHLATGRDFDDLKPHEANPLVTLSQDWESKALFYPYVLREGETWVMYYASYWSKPPRGKTSTAMGMATSADGIRWTKSDVNPVFRPDPEGAFDSRYTSSQALLRDGDHYKMYYAGRIDLVHKYYAIGLATRDEPLAG